MLPLNDPFDGVGGGSSTEEPISEEELIYDVIQDGRHSSFVMAVNRKMKEGWIPDGELIVTFDSDGIVENYIQRMRKL